jgi:hypothetical protein
MKHPSNRAVFAYWNERRGHYAAPERSDMEPTEIRRALADTFMLALQVPGDHPFRLAGTRLCALFGRELKGEAFPGLWEPGDQAALRELVRIAAEELVGTVACATGRTAEQETIQLELLLLPLRRRGREIPRLLGVLAPTVVPCWLGVRPLEALALGTWRYLTELETAQSPRLVPETQGGRPRRGLVVYDGGRLPG